LERFGLPNQIDKMAEAQILYLVVKQFAEIDLHPNIVSNLEMGYIYEELIRVTADLSNEEAGEHFTPREVIELMVNVLFADDDRLQAKSKIFTVYDPACGTGGMLTVAEDRLRRINPTARLHLFDQELQPESYAVCRTDMLLKGQDASRIVFGDSFTQDGHKGRRFDYMLANRRTARTGRRSRRRSRRSTPTTASTAASALDSPLPPMARSCSSSR
jgi:type I restriction enzyme M protein